MIYWIVLFALIAFGIVVVGGYVDYYLNPNYVMQRCENELNKICGYEPGKGLHASSEICMRSTIMEELARIDKGLEPLLGSNCSEFILEKDVEE